MLEQSDGGALGLVLNRPTEMTVGELLPQAAAHWQAQEVYLGGPVETTGGWCLYAQPLPEEPSVPLTPQLWLSRENSTLQALLGGSQPFLLLLGYAGWQPAQLETEVQAGNWLWGEVGEAALGDLLWHTPAAERWAKALELLGTLAGQLGGSAKA